MSTALDRMAQRTVGGLTGAEGRAAVTTHVVAMVSLVLAFGYATYYLTAAPAEFAVLHQLNVVAIIAYVACLVVVRMGHQVAAGVLTLSVSIAFVVGTTALVGGDIGAHLYLMPMGQLVFMMFTAQQRRWRVVFIVLAGVSFVVAQVVMTPERAIYDFPSQASRVTFSANLLIAATMIFVLAAATHMREVAAREDAAESARRAEYLANTDALTGLANRRPLMDTLDALSADPQQDYCVGLADLDHFKSLNDEHGHGCGDRVLATVGERLRQHIRATDSVGRWGGEEFLFVLPHASLEDASAMMERVRRIVGDHAVPCAGHSHTVTISIGVSCRAPGSLSHRVIKRADDALYEAKQSGRNTVKALAPSTSEHRVRVESGVARNRIGLPASDA